MTEVGKMVLAPVTITEEQRRQYQEEGYFILEGVISTEVLEGLRAECDRLVRQKDEELARRGVESEGITHRGSRYFISSHGHDSETLERFLFSDLMASICLATLGPDAYLFNEQFVVKRDRAGMRFAWHQDSGYIGHPHRPYLSCWCALDDVSEENGTVCILPYSRAGTREWTPHRKEEGTNDLVGYFGDDPGIPVVGPAGTIAVFSSVTFHRSGANTSPHLRRIYLAQYSAEPILNKEGTALWHWADPFLKGGRRVDPFVSR
ncbi:phytanoyl-CoA dioxygenase family protein [Chthonomonas calidirosea]|uniref:phytanoyl-CoA dioxygenase family protein n=1 Tax=Chthonomonas calidirosea TaxID=454171 RepID=UPI000948F963|nr:phytanoyl-CoA dioxygenase family protein [Chthonomonas calidirosea]